MDDADKRKIFDELTKPFPEEKIKFLPKNGKKLAYIDARDIRERLNSVVGFENWRVEYKKLDENIMACKLSIRINGDWIAKMDGSGDTKYEPEKGMLSNAFKRAAFCFGIGEYLYHYDEYIATNKCGNIEKENFRNEIKTLLNRNKNIIKSDEREIIIDKLRIANGDMEIWAEIKREILDIIKTRITK